MISIASVGDDSFARDNVFDGDSITASHFMKAAPTHSGKKGTFVQAWDTTESGSAGSKYVREGWRCEGATTWREARVLTGN